METQAPQQSGAPMYEGDNITVTMQNAFDFAFQYANSNISSHTKFTYGPVDVPAYNASKGLIYVEAFRASGRDGDPHGCSGSVTYQFTGAYGVVDVNINFDIPVTGNNTFTVGLSGATTGTGSQTPYTCSYSSSGDAGVSGQCSISGPDANS